MDVKCEKSDTLSGADQLFCLLQDPFKAAVRHRVPLQAPSLLTTASTVSSQRLLGLPRLFPWFHGLCRPAILFAPASQLSRICSQAEICG